MQCCKPEPILATQKFWAQPGNTIIEYALVGTGILVVTVMGLTVAGGNLDSLFSSMKTSMNTQIQTTNTASAQHALAKSSFQASAASQIKTGPAGASTPPPVSPTGASGSAVGSTAAVAGPVTQTVGANGTTDSYAQSITDQAKQSLASGAITQADYNAVVNLANKGHDIATIQGLLEKAYTNTNGNSASFANSSLTFNGQSYTPAQLNAVLTTNISDFSALRKNASVLTGVLYNAPLLSTINDSGGIIINNGNSTQQQNATAASFIQYQSLGPTTGGSTDTNQQSAQICTAGQHLDANNHCVP